MNNYYNRNYNNYTGYYNNNSYYNDYGDSTYNRPFDLDDLIPSSTYAYGNSYDTGYSSDGYY